MRADTRAILSAVAQYPQGVGIDALLSALEIPISRRTLQRRLEALCSANLLVRTGRTRATRYYATPSSPKYDQPSMVSDVGAYDDYIPLSEESREIVAYVRQPLAARHPVAFDRFLIESYTPKETWYLDEATRKRLMQLGTTGDSARPAGTYGRHILDRLLIDLSWSSSRLEGNTYSRLDTERLIAQGIHATGRAAEETQMILNHKRAIEMLVDEIDDIGFNRYTVLNLHGLLSENLLVDPGAAGRIRTAEVLIGGSVYQPSGVPQVIEEVFDDILNKTEQIPDPFEQALFILVHLPYLQPFEDVNKRVARVAANITLIKANLAPLTFVDMPEGAYIEATLGIYEMNRLDLFRDLFVWAYERSSHQYVKVRKTLAAPDPMRLKYRSELHFIVGEVVRQLAVRARSPITEYAAHEIPEEEREAFIAVALEELKRLHEGTIARYRIRPSELAEWRGALKMDLAR